MSGDSQELGNVYSNWRKAEDMIWLRLVKRRIREELKAGLMLRGRSLASRDGALGSVTSTKNQGRRRGGKWQEAPFVYDLECSQPRCRESTVPHYADLTPKLSDVRHPLGS